MVHESGLLKPLKMLPHRHARDTQLKRERLRRYRAAAFDLFKHGSSPSRAFCTGPVHGSFLKYNLA